MEEADGRIYFVPTSYCMRTEAIRASKEARNERRNIAKVPLRSQWKIWIEQKERLNAYPMM